MDVNGGFCVNGEEEVVFSSEDHAL